MKNFALTTLFACGLLTAVPVYAAAAQIPHLSGGVGKGERSRLTNEARDYNLKLVFLAEPRKAYLARVEVIIRSEQGKTLLKATSDGPWFFARLPAGVYQVSAMARGVTLDREIRVPADRRIEVDFTWPDADD